MLPSAPSLARGFVAHLHHAARAVAGFALRLAARAVNTTARAARWVGAAIGVALSLSATVDRTAIGAGVLALVFLAYVAVITRALVS